MKSKARDDSLQLVETLFQASVKSKKVPHGKTEKSTIQKLAGDAGMRKYYRISGSSGHIVACLNPVKNNQLARFVEVQKIFRQHSIRVPSIYDYGLEQGYVLQEDLGDQSLLQSLGACQTPEQEKNLYQAAIEQMIQIQKITLESKQFDQAFANLAFDTKKFMQEIEFCFQHFIEGFLNYNLGTNEENILNQHFLKISQKLATAPKVLCHRDYHSRNIVVKDGQQYVIDFQDARLGLPQYDLVSLLEDCYYSVHPSNKSNLKDFYWNHFVKRFGLQSSRHEFDLLYDYAAIQRIFKAIGSFAFIFQTRGDYRYLKYIGYAFENLRNFLSLRQDLKDLKTALCTIYYGG